MTDIEIAQQVKLVQIDEVSRKLGLSNEEVEFYGKYKAKIDASKIEREERGKVILVTAISPTPYGEGKTTVSIGLNDAFHQLGKRSIAVLREPSLGPVFGLKGGATGGGYSQVVPMEEINLHFTGDFHAITSANNLLCAAIDNQFYFGNPLRLDPNSICFSRCLDVNDRALRKVEIGLSSDLEATRGEHFNITAASEIMTILCLAKDMEDLRHRLDSILIGYTYEGEEVYAKSLQISGSLLVLLKDAIKPNLVQTLEGNPVLIHGGPFANIAHGCNSIIATKLGRKLSDYVITEAGFGADLGAEKFFDIKCPTAEIKPSAVVLVATIKSLKYNAFVPKESILIENVEAVQTGLSNLKVHIDNLRKFHVPLVVALNRFDTDSIKEIEIVRSFCEREKVPFSISTAYVDGGKGALDLAQQVLSLTELENSFAPLYDRNDSILKKISILAKEIYHADEVIYSEKAKIKINLIETSPHKNLPICVAKTQYSISDDSKKLGYPTGYSLHVSDLQIYSGAGFITVLLGGIMTMPGLPKIPNFQNIDWKDGKITGLF